MIERSVVSGWLVALIVCAPGDPWRVAARSTASLCEGELSADHTYPSGLTRSLGPRPAGRGSRSTQTPDETAVRQVIEDYVVGWREADVARLKEVFAPEGRVMWLSGDPGAERLNTMTFAHVLTRRRPQAQYGREWRVESLDVLEGRLAMAKVYISHASGHYLDYLALHKIAGQWRIVSKTYIMR